MGVKLVFELQRWCGVFMLEDRICFLPHLVLLFPVFLSMCGTGCWEDSNTRIFGQEKGFASALLQHLMRKSEPSANLVCCVHEPALIHNGAFCSLFPDLELRV